MLDQTKLNQIDQVEKMFLSDNNEKLRHDSLGDLTNETVVVYGEGYGGNEIDGDTKDAVSHGAERL